MISTEGIIVILIQMAINLVIDIFLVTLGYKVGKKEGINIGRLSNDKD